ncbi:MAG: O-antigen ligase family protein [Clostridia bacterium]|nr:O-antigen ligase family protein [Clostridia bacterium]
MQARIDVFDKIRGRSKVISFLVKLQNTAFYPAIFALICVISGTNSSEIYLPCMYILTAIAVLTGLFSDDLKVFVVPAFLVYYSLGADVTLEYYAGYTYMPPFDVSSMPHFAICLVLLSVTLIYKLISTGAIGEMLGKRGLFFWGIVCMDVALILNGLFSSSWKPMGVVYGLLTAIPLTLFYCLFLTVIARSKDGVAYACKTLVAVGFATSAQVIITALKLAHFNNLLVTFDSGAERINRYMLAMAWGPPTIVGAVIAVTIPAALYLARSRKYPLLSYASAIFLWIMTIFIDTRSAIIFGGIVLFFGMIFCCIGGRNKKIIRIVTLVLILGALIAMLWFFLHDPQKSENIIDKILDALRLDFDSEGNDSLESLLGSRADIWLGGWKDFLRAPIFGSGIVSGDYPLDEVYSNMYHNVFIEFLGSMGIVGLLAFLIHLKHGLEAIIRRYSLDKLLLLSVPLCILGMSLVDNFFFYPNFVIIYAAFLACAEVSLEHKRLARLENLNRPDKNEKPRVVFTYIEAGKGHIVPTRTVCDAFRAKYGDKVELIESKFFTETGNPDMQKTEKLFTRAVKNQNRSPLLSILCKLGNLIAGDNFALQVLLSQTASGRKTAPLAIKHMEELDAHLVYTAHWATPYYINKMKTPRPYTICFCPDVYSNGAFDVDCNNFLISSDVGEKKISRIRMYAGGNITKIPFPARPEIAELKGKKVQLREELGLDRDRFTVSLSDGGYGMARLGDTVRAIVESADLPITVVALCGTNETLCKQLTELAKSHPNDNVELVVLGFTEKIVEYIAASDLYVGKSGANSIAEPASLGVPIIVNKCSTYIETGIKNYYVRNLGGAMYIPSAKRAARKVLELAHNPEKLEPYRNNLLNTPDELYNAEASADLIWQSLCELGYVEDPTK